MPGTHHDPPTRTKKRKRAGVKHRKRWSENIVILQANVGKGERSTEAAFATAEELRADVIMMQEPLMWWSEEREEWVPRSWGDFEPILPQGRKGRDTPRVVTYVRGNHPCLRFATMQHILVEPCGDLLVVDAVGARGGRLRLVNIYSAPQGGNSIKQGAGVRALSVAQLGSDQVPTVAAGDFNAFHRSWSTEATAGKRSPSGVKLSAWAKAGRWAFGLRSGTITRRGAPGEQDSALDLVFLSPAVAAKGWTATCAVRADKATGSDHYPVVTTLLPPQPLAARDEERPLNFKRTNWTRFDALLASRKHELDDPVRAVTNARDGEGEASALDSAFAALQLLLMSCLQETTPRVRGKRAGCQYWDADCDARLRALREKELALAQARAEGGDERRARKQQQRAATAFARQVKSSKKAHFDARLGELSGKHIFAAMRWSKGGKRRDKTPPLVGEDGVARVEGHEKMTLLREVLLAPPPPTTKQLPNLHERTTKTLPDSPMRPEELRMAVFGQAQDKAAGPDGIPFRALRAAYPVLEDYLLELFGRALALGWHPRPLRQAELVALAKAGKRDLCRPRSYRLIALLPTLGKVLEKIVAVRLAELGLKHGWIAAEQFGSVPGRSTEDAVLTLVHDVEAGWTHAKPLITSALACDVRGAYDAVHSTLLIRVLYEQGAPLHLLRWILSFLMDRRARLRLDGEQTGMDEVVIGIPQGSPVSPILYILFAAPLHRLFGPDAHDPDLRTVRLIGYVDDELFYTTSSSAAENARVLRKAYEEAHRWATEHGLRFDADKKEFIQFVAPRCTAAVEDRLTLHDGAVAATDDEHSCRWLGVQLDPRLKFSAHVDAAVAAAKRAAAGMAMLMNTMKGMKVVYSRRLYIACVRSRLCYAAAVWWRGLVRVEPGRPHTRRRRGEDGRRRIPPPDPEQTKRNLESVAHARKLDSAQHAALLRAMPAFKTTSRAALQQEAACPPMDLVLDHCLDQAALRLARQDRHHPLRARVEFPTAPVLEAAIARSVEPSRAVPCLVQFDSSRSAVNRPFSTRLTALARRIPARIEPATDTMATGSAGRLANHPGVRIEGPADWALPGAGGGKEPLRPAGSLQVYTDGSMLDGDERVTGAGWVIYQDDMLLERHHTHTGPSIEVFDAEAMALMNGTTRALQLAAQLGARNIFIYVDNQSVLHALRADSASSSALQFAVISFHLQAFLDVTPTALVSFRWVRGHTGVAGNEAADTEAQLGAMRGLGAGAGGTPYSVSFATAARRNRETLQLRWQERWEQERNRADGVSSVYARTCNTPPHLRPSRLHTTLSRREYALVLHLRTGHGDFSEYHTRFKHEDARTECICGARFTRMHPLRCSAFLHHQPLLYDKRGQRLDDAELLGTEHGAKCLISYARASKAFSANRTRALLDASPLATHGS